MKILVLGSSGTGKTTICRELGEKLNIETLHLDSVYWEKDWTNISKVEFNTYMKKFLTKHKSWVIDGNYSNNLHFKYRLDAADIIIFLDFGTQVSLQGIHKRAKDYRNLTRPDMAEGCVEGIDQIFLQYVAFYYKYRAKYLKATISKYKSKKQVIIFKNRTELYKWYSSL